MAHNGIKRTIGFNLTPKYPPYMEKKDATEEEKIADFLLERGYEGVVPLYTALLIESLSTVPIESAAPNNIHIK